MSDRRSDDEDVDKDEYENPTIASLDRDLHRVLQRTDARLFVFIAIAVAASYLPKYVRMPSSVESTLAAIAIVAIVGGIGFTIYSSVKRKRKVAKRYGVMCRRSFACVRHDSMSDSRTS